MPLVTSEAQPNPGVRWRDDPDRRGGTVAFPQQVTAFHAFGSVWNLILPVLTLRPGAHWFLGLGGLASLVFAYLFVRSLRNRTHVRMDAGVLTVAQGPMWPRGKFFSHPLSDIASVEVGPGAEFENSHGLFLVTKGDQRVQLPVPLDGIVFRLNGSKRAVWGHAPVSHAAYVAARLTEAIEQVRHEGGSYRLAPGTGVGLGPGEELADESDTGDRRQQHP
jgi:hypothetical protein